MISMEWLPGEQCGDIEIGATGIAVDDSLRTAVLISLLTDRRADMADVLPDPRDGDRRGWVGDALAETDDDRIGSRLWLLRRAKHTEETRRRAEDYCAEALQWLVDDGLATAIAAAAEWLTRDLLACLISLTLPSGAVLPVSVRVVTGVA
mgnify:CR=1 FL=1